MTTDASFRMLLACAAETVRRGDGQSLLLSLDADGRWRAVLMPTAEVPSAVREGEGYKRFEDAVGVTVSAALRQKLREEFRGLKEV